MRDWIAKLDEFLKALSEHELLDHAGKISAEQAKGVRRSWNTNVTGAGDFYDYAAARWVDLDFEEESGFGVEESLPKPKKTQATEEMRNAIKATHAEARRTAEEEAMRD